MAAAELAGYEVLLMVDQGTPYQQHRKIRKLSIIAIQARTNQIEDLLPLTDAILSALKNTAPGQIVAVP